MTDTHIKINAVTPKVQYTGNGVTTVFPYEFAIFDETDMVVYLGDEVQESGYTVSGEGQTEGGNVTFSTAPADGVKITLLRSIPIERVTDFQEGGTFRPKNLNDEFDRQTAFLQQVQETLTRAVTVGPTSDITPEVVTAQIERVYNSIDNVDTVADDISNVNAVAGNATNINAVAGNATNINAVAGNATNINAVAGNATNINAVNSNKTNIDNCANNMSAITNAPTQASNAASSATAAAESAALSAQYANDKINQTHITNCITYIPQDIKLELNNGTLTLKAGSKVYIPNGVGVFNAVTVANDSAVACSTATGQTMVLYRTDGLSFGDVLTTYCNSGTTPTYGFFYDTSTNKIDFYTGSAFQGNTFSFPLAIITVSSGTVTSIDQVFNGFGFIGNTIFGLPGVKGLWPDGRNADGTLKNIVKTIDSVTTHTWSHGLWGNNFPVIVGQWGVDFLTNTATFVGGKRPENPVAYTRWYNNEENYWEDYISSWNKTYFYIYGYVDLSNGAISNFNPKTVFHALDWNDGAKLSGENTFSGNNTFTGDNTFTGYNVFSGYFDKRLDAILGTTPSSEKSTSVGIIDNNGTWLGGWQHNYRQDGAHYKRFDVRKQDGSDNYAGLEIGYDSDQNQYAWGSDGVRQSIVGWGMPNYTAAVSKTKGTNYVAETNGFLIGYDKYASGSATNDTSVSINDVNVRVGSAQGNYATNTWCYPIAKGSSYSYSGTAEMSMYFVPAIGG